MIDLVGVRTRDGLEIARTTEPVWVDLGAGLIPRGLARAILEMSVGAKAQIVSECTHSALYMYIYNVCGHLSICLSRFRTAI